MKPLTIFSTLMAVVLFIPGILVNPAMAAKPLPEIKLTAGPMVYIDYCRVVNHTDQTIEVFMESCRAPGDNSAPAECFDVSPTGVGDPAPVLGLLAPGHYTSPYPLQIKVGETETCEITYKGNPGDITGTACGRVDSFDSPERGCIPLQAP